MEKHITLFILCMLFSAIGLSQTQIQGKVTDASTGEGIILGNVALYKGGVLLTGVETDFDGNYSFNDIDPGTYDVEVSYVGYNPTRTNSITAAGGKVTVVDIELSEGVMMDAVEIFDYKEPLISFDETQQGQTLSSEQIEALPTKNIAAIAATSAGVSVNSSGDISIRGSRPEATVYYIDGIRVNADNAASMVVQADIEQLQVITGGIGARYGDVTGGAISITSKGPSERFSGGLELETSEFLDAYGYNLINANVSGPIWKKTMEDGTQRSVLGFRLFGQYRDIADASPSAVGVYRAPESLVRDLEANPIRYIEGVAFPSAQFLTSADIPEPIKAQPNDDDQDLNIGGKIDARISDAIDISMTGSYYDQSNRFDVSRAWSLLNWVNNPYELRDGFRTNFRFRHKLGTQGVDQEKTSTIRNASYILQFGYEKGNRSREDFRHEDRLFNYGYYGSQVVNYERRSSEITSPDTWTRPFALVNGIPFAYQGISEVPGEFTADPNINPVQATNDYNDLNGIRNNIQEDVFDMFNNVGRVYNLNFKEEQDRYTVNVNAGFDIFPGDSDDGKHNIQFGFTYEQRVLRNWEINPIALWTLMRGVTNTHISNGVDTTRILGTFLDPVSGQELELYAPNDDSEQFPDSKFFRSVREQLGVEIDSFINPDGLDPNSLSLDMFSASELNNFNNLNLNYFGYDYLGNALPTTTTFEDFFSEVDANTGRRTFNVAPFTPNYIAGYIQDKFIYKDIVFRLGVRMDYYDANTKVLIDPFALSDIQSATDFYNENPDLTKPESVGEDYKVYVTEDGGTEVIGYRDGNVWFQPDGSTTNGNTLFGGNIVFPAYKEKDFIRRNPQYFERLDDGSIDRFDVDNSFRDYDPQLNIMPRLAFSFPISEDAGFFAHYDVLVQRPAAGASTATALDYYYFNDGQRFSTSDNPAENPDLKPEKTIDYEVGFQQKISNSSALKVSAYYKELRDMVQRRTFNFIPDVGSYETYDNLDFGTVKGFSFGYDLRRTGNFQLNATYTLQFADGTGSDRNSGQGLNSRRNIRTLLPLSNDERHRITAVADYRFGAESGPMVAGKHILSNAGVNLLLTGISGRPYSTFGDIAGPVDVQIVEAINETRLPWVLNADLQIDKNFKVKLSEEAKRSLGFNVYLRVTNLFDLDNVIDVYQYKFSLSPDDTGWLTSTRGQQTRDGVLENGFTGENYDSVFAWRTLGQTNYSRPRQIFLGVIMNF